MPFKRFTAPYRPRSATFQHRFFKVQASVYRLEIEYFWKQKNRPTIQHQQESWYLQFQGFDEWIRLRSEQSQ